MALAFKGLIFFATEIIKEAPKCKQRMRDLNTNCDYVSIAHLNIRSLVSKFQRFNELFNKVNVDVFAITETWLNSQVPDEILYIPGYNLIRNDRLSRGGGVAFYIRNNISFKIVNMSQNNEQLWINFSIHKRKHCVGVIYRPAQSNISCFLE